MMKSLLKPLVTISIAIIFITTSTTSPSRAEFIQWQTGNLHILQGCNYAGPLATRTTLAFEYAKYSTSGA